MKNISFTPQAYKDYLDWLKEDRKVFTKLTGLIKETAKQPFTGTGKPEKLKHNLSGHWSRRINSQHRLVYRVSQDNIIIVSCKFHYDKLTISLLH